MTDNDNTIKIVILGRIPSKKNSRVTNRKTGMSFCSLKYKQWHRQASNQLLFGKPVLSSIFSIKIMFFWPDLRRTDMSNKAESIMDLLVDNKILKDDCWKIVPSLELVSAGVDKINPRAEIFITTSEEI